MSFTAKPAPASSATRILKGAGDRLGSLSLREFGRQPARREGAGATASAALDTPVQPCEPSVELVQLAGQTRARQVRCSCGEELTIELEYEGDPA